MSTRSPFAARCRSVGTLCAAIAVTLAAAGCGSDSSISVYIPATRSPSVPSTPTSVVASPTRTTVPTNTATVPPSATNAPMATATQTASHQSTRTSAATATPTSAQPATATVTSPPSATVSPTASATSAPPTATSTATVAAPTATLSATRTATATSSPTAPAPPTVTSTVTGVPTGTAAATVTASASAAASVALTATATRTFTATVPPSLTFTPTASPTMGSGAVCGDRVLETGETCAHCAADCVVGPCNAPGTPTQAYVVDLVPPLGFQPTTATVLLAYNSTLLSLPGSGTVASVRQRVVALAPVPQAFTPNDLDYGVRVLESRNVPLGTLFTATFDRCAGAAAPSLDDVACTVESCAAAGTGVPGCTCTVRLP